ncbi:glutamine amidotransferase-related protein [Lactobacillus delbrueckii]|uniref:glutamine amidotransferase-related protein n=1 Tax=Lactobacillus delbrueckii TaxID=1584 RepID=UPI0024A6F19A|nr:hypothetical protein [Lactobacillus delbrueckii]
MRRKKWSTATTAAITQSRIDHWPGLHLHAKPQLCDQGRHDRSKASQVWFKNVNDKTIEGLEYLKENIKSVQFHPEACGGPHDTEYLFDSFMK